MDNTVTIPRKARLAAYWLGTIGSDAMAVMAGLAMTMGYAQAKWFLGLSIAWHIIQGQLSQLASNNVPAPVDDSQPTSSDPDTDPADSAATAKPAKDDAGNGDLPDNVKIMPVREGN